ncbi:MAG: hypothetical protein ACLQBA_13330 [Candidatus Binataceae bacterium]
MTIAVGYVSTEGVVLGADSTATASTPLPHFLNYAQKIFEIGDNNGTLGIVAWGIGGSIGTVSYRTLIARLADKLSANASFTVVEAANQWADLFWQEYSKAFAAQITRAASLIAKGGTQTPQELAEVTNLAQQFTAGFCLGGYSKAQDRTPQAFQILFDPRATKPQPALLPINTPMFWGAPNMAQRLLTGIDPQLLMQLITSGKWTGPELPQLMQMIQAHALRVGSLSLPIRDAIDLVHSSIYSTIKAFKFSQFPQICGGPIEIAVVTSDRNFRWVRHKRFDAAITEQEGEAWPTS